MTDEATENTLTEQQIEEYKLKYPTTFETLGGLLPDHIIASGCDSYDGCSKDELMAALLAKLTEDAMLFAMLHKAAEVTQESLSEEMPNIFSERKKNNKA